MMIDSLFYVDSRVALTKSYRDLFSDIKNEPEFHTYCQASSCYEVFKSILFALLLDKEIVLLDSDFTEHEVNQLIVDHSLLSEFVLNPFYCQDMVLDVDSLFAALERPYSEFRLTLFTSGTTGLPKKVSHTLNTITRFVRRGENHVTDKWGFCYNPTHMAGIQVFFQALLNLNPIIQLFGLSRDSIFNQIADFSITHLSATPTFYRLLLATDKVFESVSRLTSGGEKFDIQTSSDLQIMFPRASITNIYASTEAGTLFASDCELFKVKLPFESFIKIENEELFLHRSLMGECSSIKTEGDWYATGDLVKVESFTPLIFRFLSRKNDMINVGGYKVNPLEVEEVLKLCSFVGDVCVYGKPNRLLGNIVCCEIIRLSDDLTELDIRNFLRGKLQEFKIPRFIKFVESLTMTRTGKKVRNNR